MTATSISVAAPALAHGGNSDSAAPPASRFLRVTLIARPSPAINPVITIEWLPSGLSIRPSRGSRAEPVRHEQGIVRPADAGSHYGRYGACAGGDIRCSGG